MTVNRMVSAFAGFMVILSLALAQLMGQIDLRHPSFLWFTAFVGLNLFQMAFTGFCPAARVFQALGFKDSAAAGPSDPGKRCC
jgi:hypothetical protein